MIATIIAFFTNRPAWLIPVALLLLGLTLLTVRACSNDDEVEEVKETGRTIERAAQNEKVLDNAEKITKADDYIRTTTVDERMRNDPRCRDCAD